VPTEQHHARHCRCRLLLLPLLLLLLLPVRPASTAAAAAAAAGAGCSSSSSSSARCVRVCCLHVAQQRVHEAPHAQPQHRVAVVVNERRADEGLDLLGGLSRARVEAWCVVRGA
jgi:hypothetical protein